MIVQCLQSFTRDVSLRRVHLGFVQRFLCHSRSNYGRSNPRHHITSEGAIRPLLSTKHSLPCHPLLNRRKLLWSRGSSNISTSTRYFSTHECLKAVAEESETDKLRSQASLSISRLNTFKQRVESRIDVESVFTYKYKIVNHKQVCSLHLHWPETVVFTAQGKKRKVAQVDATNQALDWLIKNNYCDNSGKPIFGEELTHDNEASVWGNNAVSTLHGFKQNVKTKIGVESVISFTFNIENNKQCCTVHLHWPETVLFTAQGKRKKSAQANACSQALDWLLENNYCDTSGKPVFGKEFSGGNRAIVNINDELCTKVDEILKFHSEHVASAVQSCLDDTSVADGDKERQLNNVAHPILDRVKADHEVDARWNQKLKDSFEPPRLSNLPIEAYKSSILETISENRVTIIRGETGCGKSTKIPQFILNKAIQEGRGGNCNIAVAQPRRLSAIELAKRVAFERGERVGSSVGYAAKFLLKRPTVQGGSIMFFTGGRLAVLFSNNPTLKGVSHVVLDEAHLRDIATDTLMILIRKAMRQNDHLRLVIMSATIKSKLFQSYFSEFGDVAEFEIPGRTFPVVQHFLDDLPRTVVKSRTRGCEAEVDIPLTAKTIEWIDKNKPQGAILVFVSGWLDMIDIKNALSSERNLDVIPVHAMLRDNSRAFVPSPTGKRKVILATNVAETSITFPDVVYVIDCGVHKRQERALMRNRNWSSSKREVEWITKANMTQRSGRAGRVQSGESFHLYTHAEYENMENFEPPKILTDPLEEVVMNLKMVVPHTKAVELFSDFPTSPPTVDVEKTVNFLKSAGLLSYKEELPTPLSKVVMGVSASLPSAIALVRGLVLRCFSLVSAVIAFEESGQGLRFDGDSRADLRKLKGYLDSSSDHIANGKALLNPSADVLSNINLSKVLDLHKKLKSQVLRKTTQSLREKSDFGLFDEHHSKELAEGVLLNGPCTLVMLEVSNSLNVRAVDESGMTVGIRSGSVNYSLSPRELGTPFLMYLKGHTMGKVSLVNETTAVCPLSLLLFSERNFRAVEDESHVELSGWKSEVKIIIPKEHLSRITGLRRALKDTLNYFLLTEILHHPDENYPLMCDFRRQLLTCVTNMLVSTKTNPKN